MKLLRLMKTLSETYRKLETAKHLLCTFPVHCRLKKDGALYTLPFKFAWEKATKTVQANKDGLKLTKNISLRSLLKIGIYWRENKRWVENMSLLVTSKEAGLEVHAENAKCMIKYRQQNGGIVLQDK
jgi:hypothetical protein